MVKSFLTKALNKRFSFIVAVLVDQFLKLKSSRISQGIGCVAQIEIKLFWVPV